jgi:nucleoside-diphosphate-sugar epimerase
MLLSGSTAWQMQQELQAGLQQIPTSDCPPVPPSSPRAVVFDGRSLVGVNETAPYAKKPMDYYTATKIKGEQIALAANGPQLATCALRPSAIYGEGDQVGRAAGGSAAGHLLVAGAGTRPGGGGAAAGKHGAAAA